MFESVVQNGVVLVRDVMLGGDLRCSDRAHKCIAVRQGGQHLRNSNSSCFPDEGPMAESELFECFDTRLFHSSIDALNAAMQVWQLHGLHS